MHPRSQGLPLAPRSRSRSRPRPSHDSSSVPVRPERSLRNKDSSSFPPPSRSSARSRHTPSESSLSSSRSSDDSLMSSASSFFDRIRAGTGYTSSRTSIDEDEAPAKLSNSGIASYGLGDGSAIWNSVASAASSLTVNVSKAWASNITVLAGEETPPGTESRLTRAMKAYHREKANSPADLPAFLFDEHERRVVAPSHEINTRTYSDDLLTTSRGLRGVYQAAAESTSSSTQMSASLRRPYEDSKSMPSKATDRLKAMRDAKRSAAASHPGHGQEGSRPIADIRAPPPRVGLPSGPGRGRY